MKSEKVWKALLLTFSSLLIAFPAKATELVEFRDYDATTGTFTNAVRECAFVTGATRTLESGWYAVKEDVVFASDTHLTVEGDAHLILCDGATLAITNLSGFVAAVDVSVRDGARNSLTIYGQVSGTGTLFAKASGYGAGIGGGKDCDGGAVTINGGIVEATGGMGAAGIGCGYPNATNCAVTINGGTVTATGGLSAAGIGGGYNLPWNGTVTITGGRVTAKGDGNASAIGPGEGGSGGSIEISGGLFWDKPDVAWIAPDCVAVLNPDAATKEKYPWKVGIRTCTVTIGEHPNLTVAWTSGGGSVTNAVEGTGFEVPEGTEDVKVVFTPELTYDLVGDAVVNLGKVTKDVVFGEESGYKVPKAEWNGSIAFRDYDATTGTFTNAARKCTLVTAETRTLENGWYAVQGTVTIPEGANLTVKGTVHLILCDGAKLSVEKPGEEQAAVKTTDATLLIYGQTAGTGALVATGGEDGAGIGGGGYKVSGGKLTINGGKVTATGGEDGAGIGGGEKGDGGTVTINGGEVTATGGKGASGIGGGYVGGGMVTIEGGAINANGMQGNVWIRGGIFKNMPQAGWLVESYAAFENPDEQTKEAYPYAVMGIDIPYLDWDGNQRKMTNAVLRAPWFEVTDATRTLEDGKWYVVTNHVVFPDDAKLTVNGSAHLILCDGASLTIQNPVHHTAAVNVSEGASLVIYGQIAGTGALTATGGEYGAGIGGESLGAGGTVTINGGTVTAAGGENGAGIGGGYGGACGSVTINSGTVTASGSTLGAGIGGGSHGSGGMVKINGGAVSAAGGRYSGDIGPGDGGSGGTVTIFGGVFARPIKGEWTAEGYAIGGNSDSATSAAYPYAVMPAAFTVTISDHPHSTVQWTYGDGSVMNPVTGTVFKLGTGLKGVRVVFTPEYGYRFAEEGETGVRALDSPVAKDWIVDAPAVEGILCEVTFAVGEGIRRAAYVCGGFMHELVMGETALVVQLGTSIELIVEEEPIHYPFAGERTFTVKEETMRVEIFARPIPKGMEGNPFQVGAEVFATTNAAGELAITGTGAMSDFASSADVPWVPAAVTAVTVGEGVTQIGANAWSGMEDSVAINGTALSTVRYLAPGIGSSLPSGAISGADFETVQIIGGKAYLGVSVCTNGDLSAETESWGAVKLDPAVVEQAEDGKGLVIPVPATAEKGFMILKSKGK